MLVIDGADLETKRRGRLQRDAQRVIAEHANDHKAVLKSLLFAALFNAVVGFGAHLSGYEIELGDVIRMLVGGAASLKDLDAPLTWFNVHPVVGASYFVVTNGLALISTFLWRWTVQHWELDRANSSFSQIARGDAPWY